MSIAELVARARPLRWQIEWELCNIAAETTGIRRDRISPASRMIQDLGLDSLELVEFIMRVEERFDVTIPNFSDQIGVLKQVFTRNPLLLSDFAEAIELQWGTGKSGRKWRHRTHRTEPAAAPFLQLDGKLSQSEWMRGELYELLSRDANGITQFRRKTDGMRCVLIPSQQVELGSAAPDAQADEQPVRVVQIHQFLIDAEPVSTTAYARFLNSIGTVPLPVLQEWFVPEPHDKRIEHLPLRRKLWSWRPVDGAERQPMMMVSWFGANAYSLWANRLDWRAYRGDGAPVGLLDAPRASVPAPPAQTLFSLLPSEAQWEYAARGAESRRYPWGNAPPMPHNARVAQHMRGASYQADTIPAADVNITQGLSPFGLHHMAGNVWQWCRDWYAPDFYSSSRAAQSDPQNDRPTGVRSERGGSWVGPADLARSSYRRGRVPEARGRCLGFRCIGRTSELKDSMRVS